MSFASYRPLLLLGVIAAGMGGCATANRKVTAPLPPAAPVKTNEKLAHASSSTDAVRFAGNDWCTAGFPSIPVTQKSATTGSWTVGPNTSQWTYDPKLAKISYSHDRITYTGTVRVSDGYAWRIDWDNASVWYRSDSSFKNGGAPTQIVN